MENDVTYKKRPDPNGKGPDPEGEAQHVEDEDVLGDGPAGNAAGMTHQRQRALYAVTDPSIISMEKQGWFLPIRFTANKNIEIASLYYRTVLGYRRHATLISFHVAHESHGSNILRSRQKYFRSCATRV
jgi:hypothetical protein